MSTAETGSDVVEPTPLERVGEHDLVVVIDFGALVDGYHSDMTRTFAVGEASETQRRMLEVVAEAPVWVVHQSDAALDAMDAWNKGTHGRSGLIDRVKASAIDDAAAEAQVARYKGTGSTDEAANFACVAPPGTKPAGQ